MSDAQSPADLDLSRKPGPFRGRLSMIWAVPILALVISLGVAWKSFSDRGVLIEISFDNAAGLTAGQSVLKFRDVEVGKVESMGFSPDLSKVIVRVRVQKDVAPYIDADAKFWIVRPQVTTSGISGLDTVLTGAYLEGSWNKTITTPATEFQGLSQQPLSLEPGSGVWVTLTSKDAGALAEGAPVIFRGIKVGELRNLRLSEGGDGVLIDAFIRAPYDQKLTTASVFWDTSGFSVSIGAEGVKLNVRSLGALIQGGVEFTTLVSGGDEVAPEHRFRLFADEAAARESIFSDEQAKQVQVSILLDGSIKGLSVGDAVNFRGLRVGEVSSLSVQVDQAPGGGRMVRQRVDLALSPQRMGLPASSGTADTLSFLQEQVAHGLRARVASAGLLGGNLVVELVDVTDALPAAVDMKATPNPILPSVAAQVTNLSATADSLVARINALPVEQLMTSAIDLLNSLNKFIAKDDTQKTPDQIVGLIGDIRNLLTSPDVKATPAALRAAIEDAQAMLGQMRAENMVTHLMTAIDETTTAASAVTDASVGLPALVDKLDQLGATVNKLPLQDLVAQATDLLKSIDGLIGSKDTAALPKSLGGALDALQATLTELRQGGAVTNLNATMASAQKAADAVAAASGQLPDLVKRLDAVIANIDQLLAAYGDRSPFNDETLATLRELRRAAGSVGALARTIEQNPQSFLLGR